MLGLLQRKIPESTLSRQLFATYAVITVKFNCSSYREGERARWVLHLGIVICQSSLLFIAA